MAGVGDSYFHLFAFSKCGDPNRDAVDLERDTLGWEPEYQD